jgi:Family of unknown function (DUF6152)
MNKLSFASVGGALMLLALASPAVAHHPFAAEFDWKKPVSLAGTVTKFEWGNPHAYLYLDVKDSSGKTANWKLEMGGPAALTRLGWNQRIVKPGDTITVDAWQALNGDNFGSAKSARFSDGRELYTASSFFAMQQTPSKAVGTSGRAHDKPASGVSRPRY